MKKNNSNIRTLVTGAGSGVGQGIIKALRMTSLPLWIISSDIGPLNPGLFRSDEAVLLPKVETEGALEIIIEELKRIDVDIIFIGSEFDLRFFAEKQQIIREETGATVLVSPLGTIETAEDKWLTSEFLRKNNLPYPQSYVTVEVEDAIEMAAKWGFPLMLKDRKSTSSRYVHVIDGEEDLRFFFKKVPHPMLQKLIRTPSQMLSHEYTCSVFKCLDGRILGPFTSRRTLRGGNSWVVEVAQFADLYPLLLSIGKRLPFIGSLNIQLMKGADGPVPFEFNARFSGTTAVRAHFGFNEPEMAVRHFFLGEKLEPQSIRWGLAFRYLEEVFVEGATADEGEKYFSKGIVRQWF